MLSPKLTIEPPCEIAKRFGDARFGFGCQRLATRAVAVYRDFHAVFVVAASAMGRIASDLVEIPALQILHSGGDAVQLGVLRCVGFDFRDGAFGIPDAGLETSAIPLRPEAREPDAGLLAGAAAHKVHSYCLEVDAENVANPLEIVIDGIPPVVMGPEFTILVAGLCARHGT